MDLEQRWRARFRERAKLFREPHRISHWTAKGFSLRLRAISAEIGNYAQPADRILDAGSGPGYYAGLFKEPVLFDYAAEVFKRTPAGNDGHPICGRFRDLPFRDGVFDGLLCVGLLQCTRPRFEDIEGAARVVRKGGWFLFECLNAECGMLLDNAPPADEKRLRAFLAAGETEPPFVIQEDFSVYQAERLALWFRKAGFQVDKTRFLFASDPVGRAREILRDSIGFDLTIRNTARSFYLAGRRV